MCAARNRGVETDQTDRVFLDGILGEEVLGARQVSVVREGL